MTPRTKPAVAALLLAAATISPSLAQFPPSGCEEGQTFPDIALPSLEDGTPRAISDFRGQKLILHIFASW